jgi:hypothetical protein
MQHPLLEVNKGGNSDYKEDPIVDPKEEEDASLVGEAGQVAPSAQAALWEPGDRVHLAGLTSE